MRIRVGAEGLHNVAAEFHAWHGGEYDFPDDPQYAGWLQGQLEQRKCFRVAEPEEQIHHHPETAAEMSAMADTSADAGGGESDPNPAEGGKVGADGLQAVPELHVGQQVIFVALSGNRTDKKVEAINADGTFNLGGILKAVKRSSIELPIADPGADAGGGESE